MNQALQSHKTQSQSESHTIDPQQIKYSETVRVLDPNGRVFFHNGNCYRGIYSHRVEFIRQLFENGIVDQLNQKGLVVGTRATELQLEGYGLVLQHDLLDFLSVPEEWSIATYLDAAKTCLDLLSELCRNDLTLVDCHTGNVSLGPGGQTVWHDFGSIVHIEPGGLVSLDEFLANFYFPLMLYRRTRNLSLVRRLGMYCSSEEMNQLWHPHLSWLVETLPSFPGGKNASKALRRRMIARRSKKLRPLNRLRAQVRHWSNKIAKISSQRRRELKLAILGQLRAELERIKFRDEDTLWANYHGTETISAATELREHRSREIDRLLRESKADRVLDLGANQGFYSHLAYQHCDVVLSSDYDETAVAKHSDLLRSSSGSPRIYPLVHDVANLKPEAAERLRSHTVMALALTHHLRLGQQFPFSFIVKQLSMMTEKRLITEFMPNGLGGAAGPSPDPLPNDYTLEDFLAALRTEFHRVEVVDYESEPGSSPRTLIVCDKYTVSA